LTLQDVSILKQLANTVLKKSTTSASVNKTEPSETGKVYGSDNPKFATVLVTENIPKTQRKFVTAGEKIEVTKEKDGKALAFTKKGKRFNIPLDDLEFLTQ